MVTMRRDLRTLSMGEGRKRYVVVLQDRQLTPGEDAHQRKIEFLADVVTNGMFTGLLNCGPLPFEKLSMKQEGMAWVITLEAEDV